MLKQIEGKLQHAAAVLIQRGNILAPLVPWLLVVPTLLGAGLLSGNPYLMAGCFLAAVGIAGCYFWQFLHFARTDPDRLQSEHYRVEMRRLEVVAAKEFASPVLVESLNLPEATTNPTLPRPELPAIQDGETA